MSWIPDELPILYDDGHVLAIDKPSGLLVHRSNIANDVRVFALQLVRKMKKRRMHLVHRLDRGTSGVLWFAYGRREAKALNEMFAARAIAKTYLAVVRGYPADAVTVDKPLNTSKTEERKESITEMRCLARGAIPVPVGRFPETRSALMLLRPLTGRRHQLRRHCVHLAHPIIGDTTYGDGRNNRVFRAQFGAHRLLLHAWRTQLSHPITGDPLDVRAPLPPPFDRIIDGFGWQAAIDTLGVEVARPASPERPTTDSAPDDATEEGESPPVDVAPTTET